MVTTIFSLVGIFLVSALFSIMVATSITGTSKILGALVSAWITLGGAMLIFCGILEATGALPEYQGPDIPYLFAAGLGMFAGGTLILKTLERRRVWHQQPQRPSHGEPKTNRVLKKMET